MGDDKMSDRAKRVLDALTEYDADCGNGYPIQAIREFFDTENIASIEEDCEALTVEEEKQVIQAFLEFAY